MISRSWVLTTATCIKSYLNKKISIRAGSSSWQSGGQTVDIKREVIHPNATLDHPEHNLALLELATAVTISTAKPAPLDSVSTNTVEVTSVSVIGWGRINASAFFYPTKLQAIQISVISQDVCRKQYEHKYNVTENMFCGRVSGGKSPCFGDEGGSASIGNVVIGITNNFGVHCALSSDSAIFMKVGAYRDWIKSFTGV